MLTAVMVLQRPRRALAPRQHNVELTFGVAEWGQSAEKVPGTHHPHARAAAVRAGLSCDICPLAELHRPARACSEVIAETAGLLLIPLFKDDVLYYA